MDGEATFESLLAGIDAAPHYILFEFFIVHDEEIGRRVKTHLIEKAAQGVQIYFLYDEIGSYDLSGTHIEELHSAGILVYAFNTRKGRGNRFQINFRNHREVIVVDGYVAWVAGHKVGDEYLGKDPKFGHWRDTYVRIEGPAAFEVRLCFLEDWHWAAETLPELNWSPVAPSQSDQQVLIVPSGPAD